MEECGANALTLVAAFDGERDLRYAGLGVAIAVALVRAPVEPDAAGGNVAAPGDEAAALWLPVINVEGEVLIELGGHGAVLIAEGVREEVESCDVGAVRLRGGAELKTFVWEVVGIIFAMFGRHSHAT